MVKLVSIILIALEAGLVAATGYLLFMGMFNAGFETLLAVAAIGAVLATIVFVIRVKA